MFDHLLARETHTHEATPGVYYVTGWDDRIQSQICWAVANNVPTVREMSRIFFYASHVVNRIETSDGSNLPWLAGLAYVSSDFEILASTLFIDPLRITPDEYQRIVAEAQS